MSSNRTLPITPREIADEVVRAAGEGASLVHIHARRDDGRPTTDVDVLKSIADLIRKECDIVIGMSTGAEVGMSEEERVRVLDAKPEIASLNCGRMIRADRRGGAGAPLRRGEGRRVAGHALRLRARVRPRPAQLEGVGARV